jgi:hypothetical protein
MISTILIKYNVAEDLCGLKYDTKQPTSVLVKNNKTAELWGKGYGSFDPLSFCLLFSLRLGI